MESGIVLFETDDMEIKLFVSIENDTVSLNRNQIAELFERDIKTIGKHINNALKEEVDSSVVAKFATTAANGGDISSRTLQFRYDFICRV